MLLLFFPRLYIQSVSFSIFNTFFKQHREMYLSALMLKIYWVRSFNRGLLRFPNYWQLTRSHAHLYTLSFVLPYQLCCIVLSLSLGLLFGHCFASKGIKQVVVSVLLFVVYLPHFRSAKCRSLVGLCVSVCTRM